MTGDKALTASQQFRHWGACVEAEGAKVVLQVGDELVSLEPGQAKTFAYYLARAYFRANTIAESKT